MCYHCVEWSLSSVCTQEVPNLEESVLNELFDFFALCIYFLTLINQSTNTNYNHINYSTQTHKYNISIEYKLINISILTSIVYFML